VINVVEVVQIVGVENIHVEEVPHFLEL